MSLLEFCRTFNNWSFTKKQELTISQLSYVSIFLMMFCCQAVLATENPFKDISVIQLQNGLTVVLAPSQKAKTSSVKIVVEAGSGADTQPGTAHLLEHYLFYSNELGSETSYLEVIREKGTSVNAETGYYDTSYFATVNPENLKWLLQIYSKMIFNRKFDNQRMP